MDDFYFFKNIIRFVNILIYQYLICPHIGILHALYTHLLYKILRHGKRMKSIEMNFETEEWMKLEDKPDPKHLYQLIRMTGFRKKLYSTATTHTSRTLHPSLPKREKSLLKNPENKWLINYHPKIWSSLRHKTLLLHYQNVYHTAFLDI